MPLKSGKNSLSWMPKPPFDYRFEFFKPGKKSYTNEEISNTLGFINHKGYELIPRSDNLSFNRNSQTVSYKPQDKPLHVVFKKTEMEMDFYLGRASGKFGQVGYLAILEDKIEPNSYEKFSQQYQAALFICAALKPYFAWGGHIVELSWKKQKLSFDQIISLSGWVNLFGQSYINKLGGIDNVLLDPTESNRKEALENLRLLSVVPLELGRSPLPNDSALREKEYKKYQLRWPKAFK